MEIWYLVAAFVLFLLAKGIYDSISIKKKTLRKIKNDFGKLGSDETEESLQLVDSFFIHKCEVSENFHLDNITCNDLKMADIFCLINKCKSQAGAEYLYYILSTPSFDKDELLERERVIRFFSEYEKERIDILYELSCFGRIKRKISLFTCLELLNAINLQSNLVNLFCILGLIASVVLIFFSTTPGIVCCVGMIIFNIISYYKIKGDLQGELFGIRKLCLMLKSSKKIVKLDIPELSDYFNKLSDENKKLKGLERGAFAINSEVTGSLSSSLMEYINMLFHFDLIMFNSAISNASKNKDALLIIYETLGFIDAMTAIANLRAAMSTWCVPEFTDEKKVIDFQELYHPSLSEPVPATLKTEKCILLTGSNASGKSTFLKAVALNAVLAQTIHTCFAKSYKSSFVKVYTSMALNDDIYNGESYYITEIKALKRVLDAKTDYTVLAFIDEVLRGTNTVERIASSTSALEFLSCKNVICFAATHDIELTKLLSDNYVNYHFEETLDENGDIYFDYELKEGPSNTKNAIRLLQSMGYDLKITENAERMSAEFIKTGAWTK